MQSQIAYINSLARRVPDYPVAGVNFYDITPILSDCTALAAASDQLFAAVVELGVTLRAPVMVAGIEARGFIFGSMLAQSLGAGFVPIRKPGKLPVEVIRLTYDKEYGRDTLEVHTDAFKDGYQVIVVDDLLATGGTAKAACDLVRLAGGTVVATLFLVELTDLPGRALLEEAGYDVRSVIQTT